MKFKFYLRLDGLMRKKFLLMMTMCLLVVTMQAQDKITEFSLGVSAAHTRVWAHSKEVHNLGGISSTGIQLDLNRMRLDPTAYAYGHTHFNSGFTMQYFHFGADTPIGSAVNALYFIEPFLVYHPKFTLRLKFGGGLNYATSPFDLAKNTGNHAYSLHVNGALLLGFSAYWQFARNWRASAMVYYNHFSNGNTNDPNVGLNYPQVAVGLDRYLATVSKPIGKTAFYKERWRYDVYGFLSNKTVPQEPYRSTLRFWAYGGGLKASYRTHAIHAWTVGAEYVNDRAMRFQNDSNNVHGKEHLKAGMVGILLGHEFLLNHFNFSTELGIYAFKEVPYINMVYHRWGISYKLKRNFSVGINLNASLQKAFILDGRLIYHFYK